MSVLDDIRNALAEVERYKKLAAEWQGKANAALSELQRLRAQVATLSADPTSILDYVEVETEWLPAIRIDKPLANSGGPPPTDAVGRALKPQVTVGFSTGHKLQYHPWGVPGPTRWPLVKGAAAVGGIALFALVLRRVLASSPSTPPKRQALPARRKSRR